MLFCQINREILDMVQDFAVYYFARFAGCLVCYEQRILMDSTYFFPKIAGGLVVSPLALGKSLKMTALVPVARR